MTWVTNQFPHISSLLLIRLLLLFTFSIADCLPISNYLQPWPKLCQRGGGGGFCCHKMRGRVLRSACLRGNCSLEPLVDKHGKAECLSQLTIISLTKNIGLDMLLVFCRLRSFCYYNCTTFLTVLLISLNWHQCCILNTVYLIIYLIVIVVLIPMYCMSYS